MLVLAKALRISGLASKILTRSMVVWVLRKLATWEGGGTLLAAEKWRSENKKRRKRSGTSLGCDFGNFAMAERQRWSKVVV